MAESRTLAGRYDVESVLGHGGMAEVYLGRDRVLGRPIALKILSPQYARDSTFVARFRREAQAAAALNHPNVVSVFDTGSEDGTHYIVMEYVQGKTLAQAIQEDAPILPERAVEIGDAVARALGFAHAAGIVHRDVKPGNIMLTPSGDVKVMDFGIARATSSESLTQTATVLGTATYLSPEQARGEAVDARSDIYSLGVVLYEMLTARPPFDGDSPVSVAYKHVREDPVPPSKTNGDVTPQLDAVVMKCLAKNRDNRYQSAAELLRDLERLRQGAPVMATPVMAPTEVVRRTATRTAVIPAGYQEEEEEETRGRRSWGPLLLVLVILALLGIGLFLLARSLLAPAEAIEVPDVRGRPLNVAERILREAGFRVAEPTFVPHEQVPKDEVIDYDPKRAPRGTVINLTVSGGPEQVTVPDVVCETERDARRALRDEGLQAVVRPAEPAENGLCPQEGRVARQDPETGEMLDPGSTVRIFVQPAEPSPTPTEEPTTEPPTTEPPTTEPPTTEPPTAEPPTTEPPGGGGGGG
jgi:eukaryotic-like serine/threonine-protein kinase